MSYEQYGIDVHSLRVIQSSFGEDQFLTDVLRANNVRSSIIDEVDRKSRQIFDVRKMRAGNYYALLKNQNDEVSYFIYEKNGYEYVVFDLRDSVRVYEGRRPVVTRQREAAAVMKGTLFETIAANGMDLRLAKLMEDAFASSVDFFHLKEGDFFKVIYEESFVDEVSIGVTGLVAAHVRHKKEDYYGIRFRQDSLTHYFDEEGRSLRHAFLKAPLTFSETAAIKAHVLPGGRSGFGGTEFRVPSGTPVLSVADGVVVEVNYRRGQGYDIEVRTGVYTAQYLYVYQVAEGLTVGKRISQGDELGKTGLVEGTGSGARLLFKVWQKGHSIDPESVSQPATPPIRTENQAEFKRIKTELLSRLSQISYSDQGAIVMKTSALPEPRWVR
ncbi:MAG: M23 family metallopeptidase [Bacteroidetes bacterium]|nr:MAG: M23 family metallopeptidase [Bacteroidota bacterium]